MNLEEITQETFLEKFKRKTRKLALLLTLATAFSIADCSKKKKTPFEPENILPETTIVSGPSETVNTDTVTFKWI